MQHAIPSQAYKELGEKLINEMPELAYIKVSNVKIAYLVSDLAKTKDRKPVFADTEIIPDKYKWGMQDDFSITIYHPNAAVFTEQQREILLFQQLLKIGIDYDDIANEEKYSLNEPDVVEFSVIIKRYGANWKEQPTLFDEE